MAPSIGTLKPSSHHSTGLTLSPQTPATAAATAKALASSKSFPPISDDASRGSWSTSAPHPLTRLWIFGSLHLYISPIHFFGVLFFSKCPPKQSPGQPWPWLQWAILLELQLESWRDLPNLPGRTLKEWIWWHQKKESTKSSHKILWESKTLSGNLCIYIHIHIYVYIYSWIFCEYLQHDSKIGQYWGFTIND